MFDTAFSSLLGLYQLDSSGTPSPCTFATIKHFSRYCQMSLVKVIKEHSSSYPCKKEFPVNKEICGETYLSQQWVWHTSSVASSITFFLSFKRSLIVFVVVWKCQNRTKTHKQTKNTLSNLWGIWEKLLEVVVTNEKQKEGIRWYFWESFLRGNTIIQDSLSCVPLSSYCLGYRCNIRWWTLWGLSKTPRILQWEDFKSQEPWSIPCPSLHQP